LNIGAIARQTGIEIATLRKWELRYGFPVAQRTTGGHRVYPLGTVEQLLAVRRELSRGARTGKAIQTVLTGCPLASEPRETSELSRGLSALLHTDTLNLRQWLQEQRAALSAVDFVELIAAPLAREVGRLWAQGALPVFAEHLFSEELKRVLLAPHHNDVADQARARILLTAPVGERHILGLYMANAVLAAQGEATLIIASDLPTAEIAAAARHYQVDVVGLTTSTYYPPKLLLACLHDMRQSLPASMQLWVGGAGVARLARLPAHTTQISDMHTLARYTQALPPSPHFPTEAS